MQILIDTNTDSPAEMRAVARLLTEAADAATTPKPRRGAGAVEEATAGLSEAVARLAPPAPAISLEPAFANNANVPPPPPPPPASDKGEPVLDAYRVMPPMPPSIPALADALTDSAGVKWDSKLHTSTKTKDIDGKWKARKPREAPVPLHPPTVPAGTSVAPPPPPPVPPSLPQVPVPPPPPTVMVPSAEVDADIEQDDSSGSSVVQEGAPQGIDFPSFIVQITTGVNNGSLTQARIAEVQNQFGLVSLFSLNEGESAKLQDVAAAFGFTS